MKKNGKEQNVVSTTMEQNLAAAKTCETFNEAAGLFRALQHANNMGTHAGHFEALEKHFANPELIKALELLHLGQTTGNWEKPYGELIEIIKLSSIDPTKTGLLMAP
tara:strand:+ start:112 stop:432 length:321 start_codon:yes stop_codon:yes gene_type:complete